MAVVLYEKKNQIAYVTINRPEVMNAMDYEVLAGLAEAWQKLDKDPELRVAILTGAGGKAFSAGMDIKKVCGEADKKYFVDLTGIPLAPSVDGAVKPVIAAINGYCLAGGLELALGCDIRITSETASFGCPEPRWNLLHGYGALRLPHVIPMSAAMEMLLGGDRISAQEAYRIGLVSRVVPPAELMPTAEQMAERICENGPIAVKMTKEIVYRGLSIPLAEGLRLGAALNQILMATEDTIEGTRAFVEKRNPKFKNK